MFITTSRKPSSKTRSFCQALSRALGASYTNRGKMSFRDVLIKASPSECIAVVSEVKGNPSRIEFYNSNSDLLLTLYISEALSNLKGKINPHKLTLKSEVEELTNSLLDILKIDESKKADNMLLIKRDQNDTIVIEFYGNDGSMVNPKIYVRRFQ